MSPNVKINSVQGIIGTILIFSPFAIVGVGRSGKGLVRSTMKNIYYRKAKDFKPGETVRDLGISFIVKEVRVIGEPGLISFLDTEDVWHGTYHPDEYFGAGEELARKYAATYNRQIEDEIYQLADMPSEMIH